ncbi:MAG: hypothetical protein O7A04_02855 [Acidobacteria bacterium]|nr:hypothetical protein [Acidobacteriota bacterium]
MRSVKRGALLVILILLGAAHVAYWYWPREHAGSPAADSAAAGLLASPELPLRAWVAHPHQNLAFLAHAESGANWRRGLSELLGIPQLRMPGFGPFPLPPASELAVATDEDGKRLIVAARIYPAISWIARAAGRLAGNPWLAGGRVEEGGRRLDVMWRGRTWMLKTVGEEWPEAVPSDPRLEPVLARLAVANALGPMPAGHYRVARSGRHLDLTSGGAAGGELPAPEEGVLMMIERRPRGLRATAVLGPGQGSLRGVPSAVVFAQPGVRQADLPFQKLYGLLGVKRRAGQQRGWRLVASDRLALARGRGLVPGIERAAATGAGGIVYSVDLDVVREVAAELERRLEGVPLPAIKELRQWRGAAMLVTELGAYDRWSLEVTDGGRSVHSRLWFSD